jgi:hypothetical protein
LLARVAWAARANSSIASNGVAVPGPGGGRPYLISRILVWCGFGLPIAGAAAV